MIHLKCGQKKKITVIKNILLGRKESKIETFSNKKSSEFIITSPPLQEMMKRIHQTETKGY